MSSLQRDLLRSKIDAATASSRATCDSGAGPPTGFDAGISGLPPLMCPGPGRRRTRRDYTPVRGNIYFSDEPMVTTDIGDSFKVHRCSSEGCALDEPVLFLLHGAGYSGLTWACFSVEIVRMVECSVVAMDLRGHGETVTDDEMDLSGSTMAEDVSRIYHKLYADVDVKPPVVLIGHSMGGALAVRVAAAGAIPNVSALIVIDVVEGTALDALQSMQGVLRARPSSFATLEKAIEWACRSGQTRNIDAAKVSMPAMLKRVSDGMPATKIIREGGDADTISPLEAGFSASILTSEDKIPEDEENQLDVESSNTDNRQAAACVSQRFTWRINLAQTEPHWRGWFGGLSSDFLAQPCAKLLLLAGIDRLDRDLTIGQMRGQFQMQVLPKVGHAVHEDAPLKVAEAVATFLVRNKLCKKIGDFSAPAVCC